MDSAAFYATAAQVLPTLLIAVLFEAKSLLAWDMERNQDAQRKTPFGRIQLVSVFFGGAVIFLGGELFALVALYAPDTATPRLASMVVAAVGLLALYAVILPAVWVVIYLRRLQ